MEAEPIMKVKIFTKFLRPKRRLRPGSETPTDGGLEAKINDWLASKPDIEIKNIT